MILICNIAKFVEVFVVVLNFVVVLLPSITKILKLKNSFFCKVFKHSLIFFILFFFSLFVDYLPGAVFHLYHKLLLSHLLVLLNPVIFKICDFSGLLHLTIYFLALNGVVLRS